MFLIFQLNCLWFIGFAVMEISNEPNTCISSFAYTFCGLQLQVDCYINKCWYLEKCLFLTFLRLKISMKLMQICIDTIYYLILCMIRKKNIVFSFTTTSFLFKFTFLAHNLWEIGSRHLVLFPSVTHSPLLLTQVSVSQKFEISNLLGKK